MDIKSIYNVYYIGQNVYDIVRQNYTGGMIPNTIWLTYKMYNIISQSRISKQNEVPVRLLTIKEEGDFIVIE